MAEEAPEWLTQSESGAKWMLRTMRWSAATLPDWLTGPLLWAVAGVYAARAGRGPTRASRIYLTRILGRRPRFRDLHRHALNFAHVTFDRVRLLDRGFAGFKVDATGRHVIEDLHARGQGAVLLGAHFGSFEILRAFDRTLPGMTIRYLMFDANAEKATALLQQVNPDVAARVIPLTNGPDAMIATLEALEAGEHVAFLGDRVPDLNSRAVAEIPFLGASIPVPTSPYHVALIAEVPIVLCFAPRVGRRHYAAEFRVLYDGTPVARPDRPARIAGLAAAYVGALEDLCSTHPFNWFNFFDIWSSGGGLRRPDPHRPGRSTGRDAADP